MAYTTINKSTDYFNTKLWTGNSTNSTAITGVGFQPDMVWIKNRSTTDNHAIFDAIRGATYRIYPNATDAQIQATNSLASFDSDGFTLNDGGDANGNGENIVGWNWKANGQGSANTDGTINTTYTSANTTSGVSIIQYTGNSTSGATIGHGLGVEPSVYFCKKTNSAGDNWIFYHKSLGATKYMVLNATDAVATATSAWNDTAPTSSVIYLGNGTTVNGNTDTFIGYAFAEKQGFSKFGSYVGNGSADGTFVYTGFKPAFVLLKNTTLSVENWIINDSGRNPSNIVDKDLFANQNYVEAVHSRQDFLSNGFKFRSTANNSNKSGDTYIFMAFAEAPLVGSNNIPATAR